MNSRRLGRLHDLGITGLGTAKGNIVANAVGEEDGLLGHIGDLCPQRRQGEPIIIDPGQEQPVIRYGVKAGQKPAQCRLAGAGAPDDAQQAGADLQTQVVKGHALPPGVPEREIADRQAGDNRQRQGVFGLAQQRLLLHDPADAVQRGDPALEEVGHPAHGHHRPGQQAEVGHKGHKIADGNGTGNGQPPPEIEDQQQAGTGNQGGKRREYPLDHGQADIVAHEIPPQPVELLGLTLLLGIGLNQPDGHQGGTGKLGEIGELLLNPVVALMEHGREQPGQDGQNRHGRQGQEGEAGMDVGHEHNGSAGHHKGINERNDAHAAGHLDVGEVIAGKGHDLTRRAAIEKGTIQPHQTAQKQVAQVALQKTGKADDQISPGKAKESDTYGDGEDHTALTQEGGGGGPALLQGVHRLLDHPGDVELEQINGQQGEYPPEQPLPIFLEIRHQQPDGLAGLDQLGYGRKEFNVATFCLVKVVCPQLPPGDQEELGSYLTLFIINPSHIFYVIDDLVFACRIMYSQKVM